MFFLGGFNSVLPYLLYLSLIWIFLIIGLHGKVIAVWHALNPAGQQHTVSPSKQEQSFAKACDYLQNTPPREAKYFTPQVPWKLTAFPEITALFYNECRATRLVHFCMGIITFRGPPFLHS